MKTSNQVFKIYLINTLNFILKSFLKDAYCFFISNTATIRERDSLDFIE